MWREFVFLAHGKLDGMTCWDFSINVAHEKSSQRPHFDRLTMCLSCVLLDVSSGLIEKINISLCRVILKIL